MKENLISDKSLIYQWYFNDNMSVVDNPRVKATVFGNPIYNNGIATFNGTTDYYLLKTVINLGTKYSIEFKYKQSSVSGVQTILGYDNTSNVYLQSNVLQHNITSNAPRVSYIFDTNWHICTIARNGNSGTIYIDGISLSLSGTFIGAGNYVIKAIGALGNGAIKFNGSLEYIKIWNRQLTASEVKNNYTGKTYRVLPYKTTTLFHINSDNGVIRDLTGKVSPVATNVQLPKIGSNINVMNITKTQGNIVISNIRTDGDITYMMWCNRRSLGVSNVGTLIGSSTGLSLRTSSPSLSFTRNGYANSSTTGTNALKLSKSIFIAFTSTSTGISNCYIGDTINPPTLSGAANQNAGTPVNATTLELGGYIDRFIDGWRNDDRMEQSILTIEEITQFWSNTKYKY